MKLRPGFDDELQTKGQQGFWPFRSIGRLMIVVAVCGLAFVVIAGMGKNKRNGRNFPGKISGNVPISQVRAGLAPPGDPFVIMAAAEIDASMVVPAPAGIDETMVLTYTGKQVPGSGASVLGSRTAPFPYFAPGAVPEGYLPQSPPPAQPR